MRTLLLPMCILGISCAGMAQGKSASWESLETLRAGDKIQVVQMNSKRVTGDFVDVSDAAISMQGKAGPLTIQ